MQYTFQKAIKETQPPPPQPPSQEVSKTLEWADALGSLLQNKHQGKPSLKT